MTHDVHSITAFEILNFFDFFLSKFEKFLIENFPNCSKILENFQMFMLICEFFMKCPKFRSKYTGKNDEKNKFRKEIINFDVIRVEHGIFNVFNTDFLHRSSIRDVLT